jgi:amidase
VKNLADVIAYNKAHAAEAMPIFGQETLIRAETTDGLANAKYKAAVQKTVPGARQAIDGLLKANQLAAIIGVTTGPA